MNNNELKIIFDDIITYLSEIDDKEEIFNFLRDLLSEKEILEFSKRFQVAKMLDKKISYKVIEEKTQMSSTTIARISKFLNWWNNWYKNALYKLNFLSNEHHKGHWS